jgi:hypothetical protein
MDPFYKDGEFVIKIEIASLENGSIIAKPKTSTSLKKLD